MNVRSRCLAVVASFAAVLLTGATAPVFAAEQLLVILDYDLRVGVAGCPSAPDFRRAVGQQLGYDPFREDADRRVVVRVDATARGLEARVEWRSVSGDLEGERRVSRGRDCAELVRSMAFAVAVQIRLLARMSLPPETTPTPVRSPPVADPTVAAIPALPPANEPAISDRPEAEPLVEQPAPPPVPVRRPALAIGLGLGTSAGFGLAPGLVLAGALFAELRRDWSSVELGAKAAWPPTLRQADGSGFTQSYVALTLAGCGHLSRFGACVLGDLGQTRVRGSGVDVPRSSSGTTALAGLRLALTQNVTDGFYLRAHADVLGVLTPWTVTLNHAEVWRMPRLAAAMGIDLALRFR